MEDARVPLTRPVIAERSRTRRARNGAPYLRYVKEYGNLSMAENLVMMSAYARPSARTLCGGRSKKA